MIRDSDRTGPRLLLVAALAFLVWSCWLIASAEPTPHDARVTPATCCPPVIYEGETDG